VRGPEGVLGGPGVQSPTCFFFEKEEDPLPLHHMMHTAILLHKVPGSKQGLKQNDENKLPQPTKIG
jgi:hypothetical protein